MGSDSKEETFKQPADFETAIRACGFGRFNVFLILVTFPAVVAAVMESSVISYILPSAECDLNLNLLDKGILNGVSYAGMIVSAVGWGFLADSRGRRNILAWGYLCHFLLILISSTSQNVTHLMIAKFFSGFVLCGPFSVLLAFLTEFHGQKHRAKVIMSVGVFYSAASIILPLLAVLILPQHWMFTIFQMEFSSWKVYIAVCGIPSLLAGTCFCFFPESPRFLMTHGRNNEALQTFRTIYAVNNGKPKSTYPILQLVEEISQKSVKISDASTITAVEDAMKPVQSGNIKAPKNEKPPNPMKTLFTKPYLVLSIQVYLLNFCVVLGTNTMRLWLPQLFASLYEYEQISSESSSMCTILEYNVNKTDIIQNPSDECKVIITAATYTNNLIVAGAIMMGFLVAGSVINILGDKWIQVLSLCISGTCGLALYWSSSVTTTLIITSLYSCMAGVCSTSCVGTSANLFPTSARSMILTLALTFGRIGSIVGNVMFPVFMSFGCIPPIIMVGAIMYVGCLLALSLPNTKKCELK